VALVAAGLWLAATPNGPRGWPGPRPRAAGAGRPGEPGRRHPWLGIPSCAVDHPADRSGSVGSCLGRLGASVSL